ncbi:MAG: PIN domain-containing protein [Chloroflexi bacterium]|nr:PIN domain-containing protein [Chloroflexota bacterium]
MGRLDSIFESGDEPIVNEIVVTEVRSGLVQIEEPILARLLAPMEFIQPGPESAMLAGRWRRAARDRGATLSLPDSLIAAAVETVGAAVLTRNVRDFALTPVRVITY